MTKKRQMDKLVKNPTYIGINIEKEDKQALIEQARRNGDTLSKLVRSILSYAASHEDFME